MAVGGKMTTKWYVGGLHFGCTGCGNCCAGPVEGDIWITRPEADRLAEFLNMTVEDLHKTYLIRVGNRVSIVEEPRTKDCVFLSEGGSTRGCAIYPVRPNQCRTWPFWSYNLARPDDWNMAGIKCPGINRGRFYSFEEIEKLRKQTKWWTDGY
jgi:hypothetical protein